ncbi:tetratricopeptide repeat protein [Azospirillum sp. TSO22-1]|uniref:tetratricopeptide repeat protein n=1 Tax=Azospirillum sp. TSO22-1 TaxID=716789 RepID=UPI000D60FC99|nr:tetratricopeptide repeat protein [Azospirillum sp. TSO22-1]PWC30979.1 hypothetical protein TSO221_34020 [Azospirillum sp. TSO22-1]
MSPLVTAILMQAQRVATVDPVAALDLCDRIGDLAAERDDYCLVRGECHLAAGDLDAARFWIARAAALGSLDPAGLIALARFHKRTGDHARAAAVHRAALAWLPDAAVLYNGLASAELERAPPQADVAVRRALRLDPTLPEALSNAGALAQRRGDRDGALERLRGALVQDPALAPALVNLGTVLQACAQPDAAQAVLRRALRLAPDSCPALNTLGVAALSQGDLIAADSWFRRAVAVAPTYSEALFNLGSLRLGLGDVAGARAIYERAESDRFRALGLFNAGITCIGEERFEEAASALRAAVATSPGDAAMRNQLGVALANAKRPGPEAQREALRAIRTAVCLAPEVPEYSYNLGLMADKADESLRAYARALRLDFRSPALAWSGIGVTKLRAGDAEGAVGALRTSLALAPGDQRTYSNFGAALQQAGKPEDGLVALLRALRCVSAAPEAVMLNLGQAYLTRREIETGAAYVRCALAHKPDLPVALFCLGYSHLTRERPVESERHFARAVRVLPTYWLAWNNYGAALHQQGRFDEAVACFREIVSDDPNYATAHFNLAIVYESKKRLLDAEHCYRLALQHDPEMTAAANNLGVLLQRNGRLEEALEVLGQALRADPLAPGVHSNLGNLNQRLGRLDEAVRCYRNAVAAQPDYQLVHYNLGSALVEADDPAGGLPHFRRAARLDPAHLSSRYNLACALHQGFDLEGAIPLYREVVAIDRAHYRALNNLALALQGTGQGAEAHDLFGRAVRVAAAQGADAASLGEFCAPDAGRLDDVQDQVAAAEEQITADSGSLQQPATGALFPAAVWNKSLLELAMGNLASGWDGYEFRWFNGTSENSRGYRQPLWDGRDLAGKRLFVWKEQGIGDEIMFASCVPDLTASNARITLECSPKLQPLFQRSFPFATVVTPGTVPDAERDDFDVHLPIGSLPRYYRRSLADFPDHSFLVPDPQRVAYWRRRLEELGPGPYVGISWRGRIQTVSRSHHYTRIEEWEPILRAPGVVFVNMQYDDAAEETARIREAYGVTLHTLPGIDMWNDLDNVAALLKALDLLISAGTAVMSIAGAVGLPTWLLWVDNVENWPCLGTDRLPWYPTMRLFSRTLKQPWTLVTQRIAGEFQAVLPTLGRASGA